MMRFERGSRHERAARMESLHRRTVCAERRTSGGTEAIESTRIARVGLRFTTRCGGLQAFDTIVRGGAVIEVHQGSTPVVIKASSVNRKVTLKSLERRLGPFQAYAGMIRPRAPEPCAVSSGGGQRAELWQAYQRERDAWRAGREDYQALRARHQVEFKTLLERQNAVRTAIFPSRASGTTGRPARAILNAA